MGKMQGRKNWMIDAETVPPSPDGGVKLGYSSVRQQASAFMEMFGHVPGKHLADGLHRCTKCNTILFYNDDGNVKPDSSCLCWCSTVTDPDNHSQRWLSRKLDSFRREKLNVYDTR